MENTDCGTDDRTLIKVEDSRMLELFDKELRLKGLLGFDTDDDFVSLIKSIFESIHTYIKLSSDINKGIYGIKIYDGESMVIGIIVNNFIYEGMSYRFTYNEYEMRDCSIIYDLNNELFNLLMLKISFNNYRIAFADKSYMHIFVRTLFDIIPSTYTNYMEAYEYDLVIELENYFSFSIPKDYNKPELLIKNKLCDSNPIFKLLFKEQKEN